jgi:uncharacterized protein YaaQ
MLESYLIGKLDKTQTEETLDGYKVLNTEIELARWEGNYRLQKIVMSCGAFTEGITTYLKPEDLDKLISLLSQFCEAETATLQDAIVAITQARQDAAKLTEAKAWLINNLPFGAVIYEANDTIF